MLLNPKPSNKTVLFTPYNSTVHSILHTFTPYVLQFSGGNEDEVVAKRLWSKGDYARISDSILAVDCFFFNLMEGR